MIFGGKAQCLVREGKREKGEGLTILLPGSHHPGAEQLDDLPAPELNQAQRIVSITVLAQLGADGGDTNGTDALDDAVLAEEPQSKIDVVDAAVDEDAAGELGILDEEARGVQLVTSLRPEHGWGPD